MPIIRAQSARYNGYCVAYGCPIQYPYGPPAAYGRVPSTEGGPICTLDPWEEGLRVLVAFLHE